MLTRRRTLALELPARWVEGQAPKQVPLPLPAVTPMINSWWVDPFPPWPQNLPKVNQLGASWGRLSARVDHWVASFVEESELLKRQFPKVHSTFSHVALSLSARMKLFTSDNFDWSCYPSSFGGYLVEIWWDQYFFVWFYHGSFQRPAVKAPTSVPMFFRGAKLRDLQKGALQLTSTDKKEKIGFGRPVPVGLIFIIFYNHSQVDSEHGRVETWNICPCCFEFFLRCPCCIFSRLTGCYKAKLRTIWCPRLPRNTCPFSIVWLIHGWTPRSQT